VKRTKKRKKKMKKQKKERRKKMMTWSSSCSTRVCRKKEEDKIIHVDADRRCGCDCGQERRADRLMPVIFIGKHNNLLMI